MSRVIVFSRVFPAKHLKAGEPTFFIEKIWQSLGINHLQIYEEFGGDIEPKHHTIRAGNRWKVGDKFSPRVWSGKPYCSKQIEICDDIEIKKVWDFEITKGGYLLVNGKSINASQSILIANNDALSWSEFESWFGIFSKKFKGFKGQIICWNDDVEY